MTRTVRPVELFRAMQRRNEILVDTRFSCAFPKFIPQYARCPFLIGALIVLLAWSSNALAQAVPAEGYGPYNAIFLTDGPGLTKPLVAPSPLDSRTAGLLDRLGLNREPDRDVLLEGRSPWTLAFWFRASEPQRSPRRVALTSKPRSELRVSLWADPADTRS
jgi:hypothetical protein